MNFWLPFLRPLGRAGLNVMRKRWTSGGDAPSVFARGGDFGPISVSLTMGRSPLRVNRGNVFKKKTSPEELQLRRTNIIIDGEKRKVLKGMYISRRGTPTEFQVGPYTGRRLPSSTAINRRIRGPIVEGVGEAPPFIIRKHDTKITAGILGTMGAATAPVGDTIAGKPVKRAIGRIGQKPRRTPTRPHKPRKGRRR